MATDKSNNLRILQSTKKKQMSPITAAVLGFFSGAIVILICTYTFLIPKIMQKNTLLERPADSIIDTSLDVVSYQLYDKTDVLKTETVEGHNETAQTSFYDEKNQDYNDDLLNAFKHPKRTLPHFEKEKIASTQAKNNKIPSKSLTQNKIGSLKPKPVVKANTLPAPNVTNTTAEAESDSPPGSITISITKSENSVFVEKPIAES